MIVNTLHFDVATFGAGPAGISAAIAAAREGMSVVLVESSDTIGGVMRSCPGMMLGGGYPCGISVGGFFEEYTQRLFQAHPPAAQRRTCSLGEFGDEVVYDPDMGISTLYQLLEENGVRLIISSVSLNVNTHDAQIQSVQIVSKGKITEIVAKVYIDCTGDGDIAAMAGVPYQKGNKQGLMMGATLTFFMENVDWDIAFADSTDPYFMKFAEKGISEGRIHASIPQIYFLRGFRNGSVFFNTVTVTGVDGTDMDSVLKGTNLARERVLQLAQFCKEELPGFKNAVLSRIGPLVGVRETRKLEGRYILRYEDINSATKFPDGIVACDNPLDEVFRDESETHYSHESAIENGKYYTIPFRTLVPKIVNNLLFAGRNISVDEKAFASVRGMPQCMIMGQAVGVASAISVKEHRPVQEIDPELVAKRLGSLGVNRVAPHQLL